MKNKKWKIALSVFVLFALFILTTNSVLALNDYEIVRVCITDNKFQNVLKRDVTLYGTSEVQLCDKATKKVILKIPENNDITIRTSEHGLIVYVDNRSLILQDIVLVCPKGLLGVRGLLRKGVQALYHGAFEIVQNSSKDGFYLVNLIELQDYLKDGDIQFKTTMSKQELANLAYEGFRMTIEKN